MTAALAEGLVEARGPFVVAISRSRAVIGERGRPPDLRADPGIIVAGELLNLAGHGRLTSWLGIRNVRDVWRETRLLPVRPHPPSELEAPPCSGAGWRQASARLLMLRLN